jgi:alkylation response protein AidB-like acyl-CoA dehydrogenase
VTETRHYRSNFRDISFNLFEFLNVGDTALGRGPFESMDVESAREALLGLEKLAHGKWGEAFAATDRNPPRLAASGAVVLPEPLKATLRAYWDDGWQRMELPAHMEGYGAPPSVVWAGFELLAGAHASAQLYLLGTHIARVIDAVGTPAQKARYVTRMITRPWGAAMVLTEPDAGSDVGAARAQATHVKDDEWEITGVKRFITNGDFDAVENVVHLVLARPVGAAFGTKGLSLFIVPKIWVNNDGTLGAPNGMRCSKLEKKMGLKGSVTCEMTYGEHAPCRGLLVGNIHDGIRQMFKVIEYARMAMGVKSMGTLSTAYLNARDYAKERVQGPSLVQAADKAAPRVPIIEHADVRRMLMMQKAHAEGMRALCLWTGHLQDRVELLGGHGASAARPVSALNDLMLPIVKGYCAEKAHEMLALSMQCFGGSGYIQDFPIEQYMRDQKIDSLYEGTTHIQALDLFFRKIGRDGGQTLQALLGEIRQSLDREINVAALAKEHAAVTEALGNVEAIFMAMLGKVAESAHHVGLHGNRILFALGDLVVGWLLTRHAALALSKREQAAALDRAFYDGKVASARFFCSEVLASVATSRRLIENSDLRLMEVSVDAF